ncbi:MAG TPA: hypothetical protein ENN41_00070 [Sediminispirochaeta sp.]|nr:hypothetical protein [Sediminispirochaeta sp.]
MKTNLTWKYYLIPLIYILLTAGFINLHFSELGGRAVHAELGPIAVEYYQKGSGRGSVRDLRLDIAGFKADLSEGVMMRDPGGRNARMEIQSVSLTRDRLRLTMSDGGSLDFRTGFTLRGGPRVDEGERGVAVAYRPAPDSEQGLSPLLELSTPPSAELSAPLPGLPLLRMEDTEQELLLAFSEPAESEGQRLVVSFDGATKPAFAELKEVFMSGNESESSERIVPGFVLEIGPDLQDVDGDPLRYWFFGQTSGLSGAQLESRLDGLVQRMLRAWQAGEFDSGAAALSAIVDLRVGAGTNIDLESGLLASLAEESRDSASWRGAVYTGDILEAHEQYIDQEREFLDRVRRILGEGDRSERARFFAQQVREPDYPELVSAIVFAGDEDALELLDAALVELDAPELTRLEGAAAAGVFVAAVEALRDYAHRLGGAQAAARESFPAVLTHIQKVSSGLFFLSGTDTGGESESIGMVDTLVQLRLGRALIDYAGLGGPEIAEELGLALMDSIVDVAVDGAVVRGQFVLRENQLRPREVFLASEELFPFLIPERDYYPRVVDLAPQLGENIRVWSGAGRIGGNQLSNGYEISFDFPADEESFVVVRGVENIESVELYGMPWSGDRRFQNYSVGGWYYQEDTKTLYIKFRHRDREEEIRITG